MCLKPFFVLCKFGTHKLFVDAKKKKKMRFKDEHLDTVDRPSVSAYEL